jgi:hypothetical protein
LPRHQGFAEVVRCFLRLCVALLAAPKNRGLAILEGVPDEPSGCADQSGVGEPEDG